MDDRDVLKDVSQVLKCEASGPVIVKRVAELQSDIDRIRLEIDEVRKKLRAKGVKV